MIRWRPLLLLLLALCTGRAQATQTTVAQLVEEGRLQVSASIAPEANLVPGQRASVTIKVATDRWFTGGTRVVLPEVPGLVILQTEQFASNASENRNGQNWVIQRWSLDVYAQRAGDFRLGPIQLNVQVNADEAGVVSGQISSPALAFSAAVPAALSGLPHWVVAPQFRVYQRFDRPLSALRTGDAVEREITFEGSDVMAMMLPESTVSDQPGLAAYADPPLLRNTSNRGEMRATRIERVSYIVEAPGEYLLPAQDYYWWDTSSGELQVLSLPPVTMTALGNTDADAIDAERYSLRDWVIAGLGLMFFAGCGWLLWRLQIRLPLARPVAILIRLGRRLRALRDPALPAALNPGSSAGD